MARDREPRHSAIGTRLAVLRIMRRIGRLFVIKSKFEAFVVIYGLALGAAERGVHYLAQYPGYGGWLLFACCPVAVFMAGARILDSLEREARD